MTCLLVTSAPLPSKVTLWDQVQGKEGPERKLEDILE